MGNFIVSYASRVVIYDHRAFIRLATGFRDTLCNLCKCKFSCSLFLPAAIMIFILYFLMGHPRPLLRLFSFFQKTIQFLLQLYAKICLSSILWCWDSNPRPPEHESSPITTRPGQGSHLLFDFVLTF